MRIKEFELADSFFKRLRGLMFRPRAGKPVIFIFPKESISSASIHSFFVFFEFDAVYLDKEKRVVQVFERVKPFTFFLAPEKPAKYLVEAKAGWASENTVRPGERIEW